MNWIALNDELQLQELVEQSKEKPVVIFKHSTRCSISSMALNRLERQTAPDTLVFYFLDLIRYRSLSNKVADIYHIRHESPQILLIKNGACVYSESHSGISMADIVEQAAVA